MIKSSLLLSLILILIGCSDAKRLEKKTFGFDDATSTCAGLNPSQGVCGDFRNLTLSDTDLSNRDLRGSNFSGAILTNVNFEKSNISGAIFSNVHCEGCNFKDTKALEIKVQGSILNIFSFESSTLTKSVFEDSTLFKGDFDKAILNLSYWKNSHFFENSFDQTNLERSTIENNELYDNIFLNSNFQLASLKDNILVKNAYQVFALRSNPEAVPTDIVGNSFFNANFKEALFLNNLVALNEFIGSSFQRSKIYQNSFYSTSLIASILNNAEFFDNEVSSLLIEPEEGKFSCFQDRCSEWSLVQALSLYSQRNTFDSTNLSLSNFTSAFLIDDLFLGNEMRSSVFKNSTLLNVSFSSVNLKEASFESATVFVNTLSTDQNVLYFQNSVLDMASFENFNPATTATLKGKVYFFNSSMKDANLNSADVRRCSLVNSDFTVLFNELTRFDLCNYDSSSILPFDEDTADQKGMLKSN